MSVFRKTAIYLTLGVTLIWSAKHLVASSGDVSFKYTRGDVTWTYQHIDGAPNNTYALSSIDGGDITTSFETGSDNYTKYISYLGFAPQTISQDQGWGKQFKGEGVNLYAEVIQVGSDPNAKQVIVRQVKWTAKTQEAPTYAYNGDIVYRANFDGSGQVTYHNAEDDNFHKTVLTATQGFATAVSQNIPGVSINPNYITVTDAPVDEAQGTVSADTLTIHMQERGATAHGQVEMTQAVISEQFQKMLNNI